jgi:hypothetical protein
MALMDDWLIVLVIAVCWIVFIIFRSDKNF